MDPLVQLSESVSGSSGPVCEPGIAPMLETRELSVTYGSRRALSGVSLAVPRHQILAIVGPSGCGKSTFLNSLNRLTDLTPNCRVEGSIRVDNEEILNADCDPMTLRRRVGMVFQKPNPFPLSICRNLAIPLKEHGCAKSDMDSIIEEAISDVGLWDEVKDRLNAPALSLSGGQQQRLCIARALALRPEVMLFDEPCSALDPFSINVVEQLIASLRERVTIVIVTHNLAQARRIADQAAVFWQRDGVGTVIESGPATLVFGAPQDPEAAAYLSGHCC
ncbi:MAG: phosphate ABC transporter ATP-binding protein [Planctomycetota bacterium]|nr:phosphate ABC transporter ATP-binding protein [Planctomycetota bacterium]